MTNTLYDALFAPHAGSDRTFLDLGGGREIAYGAFIDRVARVAGALAAKGVGTGDRVAVQAPKTPEALALYGACVKLGAALLPLNTAYTPAEVSYFLGDATPRLLVCDPASETALAPLGVPTLTLGAGGEGSLADAVGGAEPVEAATPRGPEDLAAILYTSGTTGRSKGAMLSHRNLLSNAEALTDLWRFTADDRLIHALPIFHTHGLFVAVNIALLAGSAMRFLPKFDADAVLEAMPTATAMMGVPTFYTRLLADPRLDRARAETMRLFVSGSAPLLAETHRQFEARTGHRILERYGMTETNMNASNPYEGERRPGTVGPPVPGVALRIADPETGAPVATGQTGMVEVKGPNVFLGYWNMPEKTAAEFRADGHFITGDLGVLDADGYLTIVGRSKDLIISGGYNVYPKEVEGAIDALPGVAESAVIGAPHPDMGEGVVAVVVPEAGATLDPDALSAALAGSLAGYKRPRRIHLVDALPRNTMGKVQKAALRERYAGVFSGGRAGRLS